MIESRLVIGSRLASELTVAAYVALSIFPVVLCGLAWRIWRSGSADSRFRNGMALGALGCGSAAALAQPAILLVLSAHRMASWLERIEIPLIDHAIVMGLLLSLLGVVLALFAWGRTRWLLLSSCLLTFALCYVSGLATSY